MESKRLPILPTIIRILTFRASPDEMLRLDYRHLALGMFCTWLVGMGRSWDNPEAGIAQSLGIGSVIYVFALSLLLWLTIRPLAAPGLSYRQVLTFVCLVSPPGLLYAIPVEHLFNPQVARTVNVGFLMVVATWRVALLVFYLSRAHGLRRFEVAVATMLPLSIILGPLTALRVLASVFEAMASVRGGQTLTDPTVRVLDLLGGLSLVLFVPLLIAYAALVGRLKSEQQPRSNQSL